MDSFSEGEHARALIAAILVQAFSDALSFDHQCKPFQARNFISEQNELFCRYCELLDLEPRWVAKIMQKRLREHDLKPLKTLRE